MIYLLALVFKTMMTILELHHSVMSIIFNIHLFLALNAAVQAGEHSIPLKMSHEYSGRVTEHHISQKTSPQGEVGVGEHHILLKTSPTEEGRVQPIHHNYLVLQEQRGNCKLHTLV